MRKVWQTPARCRWSSRIERCGPQAGQLQFIQPGAAMTCCGFVLMTATGQVAPNSWHGRSAPRFYPERSKPRYWPGLEKGKMVKARPDIEQ